MPKSMTGYAATDFTVDGDRFTIEVKSLNHRYLDMKVRSPERFYWAEERIREEVKKRLARGNVALFIKQTSSAVHSLKINTPYVEAAKKAAAELKELGVEGTLDLSYLLSQRETFREVESEKDVEADWAELKTGLREALSSVVEWREKEGAKLKSDLDEKLSQIRVYVDSVAERVPELSTEYREKLTTRIKELIEKEVDEGRLLTEAAIVAERSAIDEEIVRLKSHLERFEDLLSEKEPIGRKLDFLCQEILREVNTIGSKVSDLGVTETVVDMKAELEKVREQVQNIE